MLLLILLSSTVIELRCWRLNYWIWNFFLLLFFVHPGSLTLKMYFYGGSWSHKIQRHPGSSTIPWLINNICLSQNWKRFIISFLLTSVSLLACQQNCSIQYQEYLVIEHLFLASLLRLIPITSSHYHTCSGNQTLILSIKWLIIPWI